MAAPQTVRPWHALTAEQTLSELKSTPNGLDEAEARRRLAEAGANSLPRAKQPGVLAIFARQFRSPLIYLLVAAAALSAALKDWPDALFIAAVLLANAAIGAYQEWRAQGSAAALERLVRDRPVVRRGGTRRVVDPVHLVPGDVVELESGGRVPADLRLIEARSLSVDESILTGESEPSEKDAAKRVPEDAPPADRATVLHAGTMIDRGRAVAVVVETGARTAIGRIAGMLAAEDRGLPPLVDRFNRFTRRVAGVIGAAIVVLVLARLWQGGSPQEAFLVGVALAVAAVPEGLPVAITAALSVAASRMAARNVIVRSLPAVEGLGACTLIATDKTGTLTINRLTAKRLWLRGEGESDIDGAARTEAAKRLAVSAVLSSEAPSHAGGDAVDLALHEFAKRAGLDPGALHRDHRRAGGIPYEPHRRFAMSAMHDGENLASHVKGAPETVLAMCRDAGKGEHDAALHLAEEGYRVIAVARGPAAEPDAAPRDLTLLGFVGLIDPLRPEAEGAVRECREAGVTVAMITGDHPATARTIARQIGIDAEPDQVVTGAALARAAERDELIRGARVFARVEPAQKLDIVESLQRAGHFVAVTGDGVNDAPALRAANIGVAMGRSGADVARDAADLVLTDDNFASLVAGIEEGRVAYDNIRKVIMVLLAGAIGEILLFALATPLGMPLPLSAVQLLWLNLATDSVQVIALAFEPAEPGLMSRRPRSPQEPLVDRVLAGRLIVAGGAIGILGWLYFAWALRGGADEATARNGLLLFMVLCENVMVLTSRSDTRSVLVTGLARNPLLAAGILGALGLHLAATVTPGLSDVLGVSWPAGETWIAVLPLAAAVLVVAEVYKLAATGAWRRS